MLNEIRAENLKDDKYSMLNGVLPLDEIFPSEIVSQIEKIKSNEIDNLIIHGLPVIDHLPPTPKEIRDVPENIFSGYILKSIGSFLGVISCKNLENTVRFRNADKKIVNEETWHGHPQYKYSVFYCLRADPNAKTYFFSANDTVKNAPPEIARSLTEPFSYLSNKKPFSLLQKGPRGYEISIDIYDRSDFEKYIKDLDLPDVVKALKKIDASDFNNREAKGAVTYLLKVIEDTTQCIVYEPGDIALYNETSTMRFSPAYEPSTSPDEDRWILSLSVDK